MPANKLQEFSPELDFSPAVYFSARLWKSLLSPFSPKYQPEWWSRYRPPFMRHPEKKWLGMGWVRDEWNLELPIGHPLLSHPRLPFASRKLSFVALRKVVVDLSTQMKADEGRWRFQLPYVHQLHQCLLVKIMALRYLKRSRTLPLSFWCASEKNMHCKATGPTKAPQVQKNTILRDLLPFHQQHVLLLDTSG